MEFKEWWKTKADKLDVNIKFIPFFMRLASDAWNASGKHHTQAERQRCADLVGEAIDYCQSEMYKALKRKDLSKAAEGRYALFILDELEEKIRET